jgi:hypothetical protein
MKAIHFFLLASVVILISGCYGISVTVPAGPNATYTDDQATQLATLTICPSENIKIKASILGGIERFSTEEKKFIPSLVEYRIIERWSNGYERSFHEGSTRADIVFDATLFGKPPGEVRYSLQVKDGESWVEKDYVTLPVRPRPDPVTIQLKPVDVYDPKTASPPVWEGRFEETSAAESGRSPQAIIDKIEAVLPPNPDGYKVYLARNAGPLILVGTIRQFGDFDPTGAVVDSPYPAGQWRVETARPDLTWDFLRWQRVEPVLMNVSYRCRP